MVAPSCRRRVTRSRSIPSSSARIETVYNNRAGLGLDAEQQRLVTRTYESFVRNGAKLDAAQKQQLSGYNQQLASLFATFNAKLLADEGTFIQATEAEMDGVPADVKAAAAVGWRRTRACPRAPMRSSTPARRSIRC